MSSSLEASSKELTTERYHPRSSLTPTSSPPPYLKPQTTPTRSNPRFEIYRPRNQLPFKLNKVMTPTTVQQEQLPTSRPTTPPKASSYPMEDHYSPSPKDVEPNRFVASFNLETETVPDRPIDWTFDGPLVLGPLQNVCITPTKFPMNFKSAEKRKEVKAYNLLSLRREALLCVAENYFDRSNVPALRSMSRLAEGHFKEELSLLDSVLLAMPGRVADSNEIGYYIDPFKYQMLQEALTCLAQDRKDLLQQMNLDPPAIPSLPSEWSTDSLWRAKDLEVLCIALREDVENFLAFYWDIVSKAKGTWKPAKEDLSSIAFPDVTELASNPEIFQIRYVTAHRVLQRKLAADLRFMEAKVKTVPETHASEYDVPSHKPTIVKEIQEPVSIHHSREIETYPGNSLDMNLPVNHDQIRRRQSLMYNHRPRPSFAINSPYHQNPTKLTGSEGLGELFHASGHNRRRTIFNIPETSEAPQRTYAVSGGAPPPGDEPPDDDDDDESSGPPHSPTPYLPRSSSLPSGGRSNQPGRSGSSGPPDGRGGRNNSYTPGRGDSNQRGIPLSETPFHQNKLEAYFDNKLHPELVPEWDGDPDTLSQWMLKVNHLAQRSATVFKQLGEIIPLRLRKGAEKWFFSLPLAYRQEATLDWESIRNIIGAYYMNRAWLDRQKARATRAAFREPGHSDESPSEYYIRKTELLRLVSKLSDSELIMEVMNGAPSFWHTVIDAHRCESSVEFQSAIKYHEETLSQPPLTSSDSIERRIKNLENTLHHQSRLRHDSRNSLDSSSQDARTHPVGWSSELGLPKYPKDNSNVSVKPTPESKGARPCKHCGSSKHWDNECKHSKSAHQAHTHFGTHSYEKNDEDLAYEELYSKILSNGEDDDSIPAHVNCIATSIEADAETVHMDSLETHQPKEINCQSAKPAVISPDSVSTLGGSRNYSIQEAEHLMAFLKNPTFTSWTPKPLIKLKKSVSQPAGSAFLKSSVTSTTVWLGEYQKNPQTLVFDSGADITLINQEVLKEMKDPPIIKTGHKIKLIQATGTSSISGFVTIPIFFDTDLGPVQIEIEAYVVQGMNSPIILGNDFANQYSISLMREDSQSFLLFGNTGRKTKLYNEYFEMAPKPAFGSNSDPAHNLSPLSECSLADKHEDIRHVFTNSNSPILHSYASTLDPHVQVTSAAPLPPFTFSSSYDKTCTRRNAKSKASHMSSLTLEIKEHALCMVQEYLKGGLCCGFPLYFIIYAPYQTPALESHC